MSERGGREGEGEAAGGRRERQRRDQLWRKCGPVSASLGPGETIGVRNLPLALRTACVLRLTARALATSRSTRLCTVLLTTPPAARIDFASSAWPTPDSSPPALRARVRPASALLDDAAAPEAAAAPALAAAAAPAPASAAARPSSPRRTRSLASSSEPALRSRKDAMASALLGVTIFPPGHAIERFGSGGGGSLAAASKRRRRSSALARWDSRKDASTLMSRDMRAGGESVRQPQD